MNKTLLLFEEKGTINIMQLTYVSISAYGCE